MFLDTNSDYTLFPDISGGDNYEFAQNGFKYIKLVNEGHYHKAKELAYSLLYQARTQKS